MSPSDPSCAGAGSGQASVPEVFVYYLVEAADEAAVRCHVSGVQQALCCRFKGLRARLLRRPDSRVEGTLLTLMEIYSIDESPAGSPVRLDDLLAAIEQAVAPSVGPLIRGARHVEIFEACV